MVSLQESDVLALLPALTEGAEGRVSLEQEFLEESVFPTLLPVVVRMLQAVDSKYDLVQAPERAQDFNPIRWLAEHLMRYSQEAENKETREASAYAKLLALRAKARKEQREQRKQMEMQMEEGRRRRKMLMATSAEHEERNRKLRIEESEKLANAERQRRLLEAEMKRKAAEEAEKWRAKALEELGEERGKLITDLDEELMSLSANHITEEKELFEKALRLLVDKTPATSATIAVLETRSKLRYVWHYSKAVPELKNIRDLERELYRGQGISWDCIDKNETKWVQDVSDHDNTVYFTEEAAFSYICTPLRMSVVNREDTSIVTGMLALDTMGGEDLLDEDVDASTATQVADVLRRSVLQLRSKKDAEQQRHEQMDARQKAIALQAIVASAHNPIISTAALLASTVDVVKEQTCARSVYIAEMVDREGLQITVSTAAVAELMVSKRIPRNHVHCAAALRGEIVVRPKGPLDRFQGDSGKEVGCFVTVPIYGQPFGVSAMEVVGLLSFDTAGKDIDTVPYADVSFVENVCGELSMKVTSWNERVIRELDDLVAEHFFDVDALCDRAARLLHRHLSASRCFIVVETSEGQGTVLAGTTEAAPGEVVSSKGALVPLTDDEAVLQIMDATSDSVYSVANASIAGFSKLCGAGLPGPGPLVAYTLQSDTDSEAQVHGEKKAGTIYGMVAVYKARSAGEAEEEFDAESRSLATSFGQRLEKVLEKALERCRQREISAEVIATLSARSGISKSYFAFIDDNGHQRLAVTKNYGGAVMSVGNILPAEEAAKMQIANVHDANKKIVGVVGVPLDEFEERMKLLEEDALSVWDAMTGCAEMFRQIVPVIAEANKVGLRLVDAKVPAMPEAEVIRNHVHTILVDAARAQLKHMKKKELEELKKHPQPSKMLLRVVKALLLMLDHKPQELTSWDKCRKLLADTTLLKLIDWEPKSAQWKRQVRRAVRQLRGVTALAVRDKAGASALLLYEYLNALTEQQLASIYLRQELRNITEKDDADDGKDNEGETDTL